MMRQVISNKIMLTIQQYAKGAAIPKKLLNNAQVTVGIVNEIFKAFPNQFTFNSGYRTATHNAAVGGKAKSYHPFALAADITPINGNYNQYKSALISIVSRHGWELVDERHKNHFHIEPAPAKKLADVMNNQQPTTAKLGRKTFVEKFNLLSPRDKTIVTGSAFLLLLLFLRD